MCGKELLAFLTPDRWRSPSSTGSAARMAARAGRRPLRSEAPSVSRRRRQLSVNSVRGDVPECTGR
jgi:hypothetical protein